MQPIMSARELVVGSVSLGWSALAVSFHAEGPIVAGGQGPSEAKALADAMDGWRKEHDRREREAVVAALAGEPRRSDGWKRRAR
jgi:hypothetical protein